MYKNVIRLKIYTFKIIILIYNRYLKNNFFFLITIFKLNSSNFIESIHNITPLKHAYSKLPLIIDF
jgi:hypothetical protein